MNTEAISITESKRRIELEAAVRKGESAFIEVGTALLELRDSRLYRNDFETFEEYCQETFGWSARRGRQLMAAAALVDELEKSGTSGSALPKSEREARKVLAERKAAERKPICDTPAKNPPPVVDVEPQTRAEVVAKQEEILREAIEDKEREPAKPKLTLFEEQLEHDINMTIDDLVALRDAIRSQDSDPEAIKEARANLTKLNASLHKFEKALLV